MCAMIHEQCIPGRWQDDVDVNDFLSLNKKPFLKDPIFLKNSSNDVRRLQQQIQLQSLITPEYASLKEARPEYINKPLEKIAGFYHFRRLGFTDTIEDISKLYEFSQKPSREKVRKTPFQYLSEVSTAETLKMMKIGVFEKVPFKTPPSYIQPDVRRIALYGTKRLIEEKRYYLKTLEKHLQTHDWIEKRIAAHRAIESLKEIEKYAKSYRIDISEPAENAKEAIQFVFLAILATLIENPSIPFSLTQVIPFLDVYIEQSISDGVLTEEEAQRYMDEFAVKLNALPWTHATRIGETIRSKMVTKTTYRFLQSIKEFDLKQILIHVEWVPSLHKEIKNRIDDLIKLGHEVRLYDHPKLKDSDSVAVYPHGQMGKIGEEAICFAGLCNLEKVFYLAVNGGKDVGSKSNLMPITQPIRKESIEYDDVLSRFKEYLSYCLSVYVEMANTVLYVNETNHNHPLRNALMDSLVHYKIQFGFHRLPQIAKILAAIEQDKFTFTKDSKGWILKIEPKDQVEVDPELYLADLMTSLEEELIKIPMYNKGKALLRFEDADEQFQIPLGFHHASLPHFISSVEEIHTTPNQVFEFHIRK